MTPERLVMIYEEGVRERRQRGFGELHWRDIARFFGVRDITVRRWRSGETPIPRAVELVLEIMHGWPEVTLEGVEAAIRRRDEAAEAALDRPGPR